MKIALLGSRGKTGQLVKRALLEEKDMELGVEVLDASHPPLEALAKVDAVIDFSAPEATGALLRALLELRHKPRLVIGTTALSQATLNDLRTYSQDAAILLSANFALGILLMHRFLEQEGGALLDHGFHAGLQDIHHTSKKDAPSGTALMLMQALPQPIPTTSLRMGQVMGVHQLIFEREGELLEIRHQITDRRVFALGALHATRRLSTFPPGFYDWKDLWNTSKPQN
jgi:4-hydroxy-tetrahydrodipicolinate reductase